MKRGASVALQSRGIGYRMNSVETSLAEEIQRNAAAALREDVSVRRLVSQLVPIQRGARASVICREPAIVCGIDWFSACFSQLDPLARITWRVQDGARVVANEVLCEIEGQARAMLTAERTALNFLQLLSATATLTHRYVEAVAGTAARIVDTRKTIPCLRLAQKYAVRTGGGNNHRIGLYDGVLIKENRLMAAGGIIRRCKRRRASHHLRCRFK